MNIRVTLPKCEWAREVVRITPGASFSYDYQSSGRSVGTGGVTTVAEAGTVFLVVGVRRKGGARQAGLFVAATDQLMYPAALTEDNDQWAYALQPIGARLLEMPPRLRAIWALRRVLQSRRDYPCGSLRAEALDEADALEIQATIRLLLEEQQRVAGVVDQYPAFLRHAVVAKDPMPESLVADATLLQMYLEEFIVTTAIRTELGVAAVRTAVTEILGVTPDLAENRARQVQIPHRRIRTNG